jgi:hypothetical protein
VLTTAVGTALAPTNFVTDGGNISFYASTTGNGPILVADYNRFDTRTAADRAAGRIATATGGGTIRLSGGANPLTDYANGNYGYGISLGNSPGTGNRFSLGHDAGIAFYSGGGDIILRGQASGSYNIGGGTTGIQAYDGLQMDAGVTGSILLTGYATSNVNGGGAAIELNFATVTSAVTQLRTTDGNVVIDGTMTGPGGGTPSYRSAVLLGGTAGKEITIAATGTGSITVTGNITSGLQANGTVIISGTRLLAASGDITITSNLAGTAFYQPTVTSTNGTLNTNGANTITLGALSGSPLVSSSTSNITLKADVFVVQSSNPAGTIDIETAGTVRIIPFASTGFSAASTITTLNVGKAFASANDSIASFTLGNALTGGSFRVASGYVSSQGAIKLVCKIRSRLSRGVLR